MKTTLASRLRQLFAMLGSNNAQERETARAKIDELLAKDRKSWNDLTELMSSGTGAQDPAERGRGRPADRRRRDPRRPAGKKLSGHPNALEYVRFIIEQHVAMEPHETLAAALWVLHTHVFERFVVSPRSGLHVAGQWLRQDDGARRHRENWRSAPSAWTMRRRPSSTI